MAEDQQASRKRFAHELLSPLTVILGSAEMLQNRSQDWPEYAQELLQLILTQGRRLQETLDALVTSAELEGDAVCVRWAIPPARPLPAGPGSTAPTDPGLAVDDQPGGVK